MRKILIATPVLALTAVACSQTTNFKNQTEDFINDNAQVEAAVGGDVSDASCEEPESTDVGTDYSCTAQVAGIGEVSFSSNINAEDSFIVTPQP
ncbi:MAG: hypothetical protein AB8G14_04635 [Ilumatobacter sp.]